MNNKLTSPDSYEQDKEFIFRFKLEDLNIVDKEEDPLVNMVRFFIQDLQQIGFMCSNGMRIHVDGFVLNNQPETLHNLEQTK